MSIADLRARALAHNSTIRWTYPVCLNPDKKQAIDDADKQLKQLHTELAQANTRKDRAESTQRRTMGEAATPGNDAEVATLQARIDKATERLSQLETDALDESVLLKFRRLDPDQYQKAWDEADQQSDGKADPIRLEALKAVLRASCYANAEDADGNDLNLTWGECCTGFLNSGDFDNIGTGLILWNRSSATVPFNQANSGLPATS